MMGTFDCVYETPCHFCTKYDKPCDKKMGKPIPKALQELLDTPVECNHSWQQSNSGGADSKGVYDVYVCKYCGATKNVYSWEKV